MDAARTPQKHQVRIEKHFDGDTSKPPDEVLVFEQWNEADGSIVTNEDRIAELEASIARKEDQPWAL